MADGILLGQAAVRQLAQMVSQYNREYANEGRPPRRQPVIHPSDSVIAWGILLNDLANNGRVQMRVQVYNTNTRAWDNVTPEQLVYVTARNVPTGKAIPKDSAVGASQISQDTYCVLVSDCPKTIT